MNLWGFVGRARLSYRLPAASEGTHSPPARTPNDGDSRPTIVYLVHGPNARPKGVEPDDELGVAGGAPALSASPSLTGRVGGLGRTRHDGGRFRTRNVERMERIREVVARLGVADVRAFGLTWEDCEQFLKSLGCSVHVEVVATHSSPALSRAGEAR